METKSEIRKRMIATRDALSLEARAAKSEAICAELFAAANEKCNEEEGRSLSFAFSVAVYAAMGSEVSLDAFVHAAYARAWRVCFPVMVRREDCVAMEFRVVDEAAYVQQDAAFFVRPARSIVEGSAELAPFRRVALADIDFMVVPMVAFDASGMRLGYGGGNYDRALAGLRPDAGVAGAAFAEQRTDWVPAEPHDRALARIVSA